MARKSRTIPLLVRAGPLVPGSFGASTKWRIALELLKRIPGLEVLRHAVIITDVAGVITFWGDGAAALLGWPAEEATGQPLTDLIALELTPEDLLERIDNDHEWTGEMAVRKRQGTAFLARVFAVALTDELGHLAGVLRVVIDITDATWARRRELEEGQRARRALSAAHVGSWQLDTATGVAGWDESMERLFGLEPGTFPGSREAWRAMVHEADREWATEEWRRAITADPPVFDIEYRIIRADGQQAWINVVGGAAGGAGNTPSTFVGVAFDITERRHAEQERAAFLASERARRDRFTLLAEASAAFAESLDDSEVMAAVGKLAVPRLADWCAIDLAGPTGIVTAAAVHNDRSKRELVAYLGSRFSSGSGVVPDVPAVIQDGVARLLPTVDVLGWPQVAEQPEYRAVLNAVGVHSLIIVPLTARGRTFGAMTLAIGDSELTYSSDDLNLAEDLARRAALSIDNARLFADRTHVARVLQASLLPPELPDVPGASVAARYRAAVAGSDIGGDFYDVFQTAGDRWSVVLGDVSGKGTDAAVLTGLARHTLRAAAIGAESPVEVLSALNHAVLAPEYGERFVTLAYAQMEIGDGSAELVVSTAGHPNPLIVRSDGRVEALTEVGGIVGLFEDVDIVQERVSLASGDLLVLYTDGVLEARDRHGEFYGEARLMDLLASAPARPPDEVAERIENAVMAFQDDKPRDDIAILVVGIDDAAAPQEQP